ncbi:hypothetical protein RZ023_07420 [Burkholderia pseudomallei]|uniref:hypothetical protein n=1 Tax=Burkholderia pseudomallei TaxID=28450 RepID=UPI002932BA97|nr:hypothetical protein [Burkholderia pseudomallei]MDV2119467.1 hypothetical protein [Burkholderia pseudomallei]MDV2155161.1 hypothetical protein [Burkholderia pseudomallei]
MVYNAGCATAAGKVVHGAVEPFACGCIRWAIKEPPENWLRCAPGRFVRVDKCCDVTECGVLRQHERRAALSLQTAAVHSRDWVVAGEQLDRSFLVVAVNIEVFEIVVSRFFSGSAHVLRDDWGVLGPDSQASLRRLSSNKDAHQIPGMVGVSLQDLVPTAF